MPFLARRFLFCQPTSAMRTVRSPPGFSAAVAVTLPAATRRLSMQAAKPSDPRVLVEGVLASRATPLLLASESGAPFLARRLLFCQPTSAMRTVRSPPGFWAAVAVTLPAATPRLSMQAAKTSDPRVLVEGLLASCATPLLSDRKRHAIPGAPLAFLSAHERDTDRQVPAGLFGGRRRDAARGDAQAVDAGGETLRPKGRGAFRT